MWFAWWLVASFGLGAIFVASWQRPATYGCGVTVLHSSWVAPLLFYQPTQPSPTHHPSVTEGSLWRLPFPLPPLLASSGVITSSSVRQQRSLHPLPSHLPFPPPILLILSPLPARLLAAAWLVRRLVASWRRLLPLHQLRRRLCSPPKQVPVPVPSAVVSARHLPALPPLIPHVLHPHIFPPVTPSFSAHPVLSASWVPA